MPHALLQASARTPATLPAHCRQWGNLAGCLGSTKTLWSGVSRQLGQWFLHQIPTPAPGTPLSLAVGAWEGGDGCGCCCCCLQRAGTGLCVPRCCCCPPCSAACPARARPLLRDPARLAHSPRCRALPTLRGSHARPRLGWLLGAARQQPAVPALSHAHAECVSTHACTPAARLRALHSHTAAPAAPRLRGDAPAQPHSAAS